MKQIKKITDEVPHTHEGLRSYLRHLEPELKETAKRLNRLTALKEEAEKRLATPFGGVKAGTV